MYLLAEALFLMFASSFRSPFKINYFSLWSALIDLNLSLTFLWLFLYRIYCLDKLFLKSFIYLLDLLAENQLEIPYSRFNEQYLVATFNYVSMLTWILKHLSFFFLFLVDQVFYSSYVNRQHFRLRSFASNCVYSS